MIKDFTIAEIFDHRKKKETKKKSDLKPEPKEGQPSASPAAQAQHAEASQRRTPAISETASDAAPSSAHSTVNMVTKDAGPQSSPKSLEAKGLAQESSAQTLGGHHEGGGVKTHHSGSKQPKVSYHKTKVEPNCEPASNSEQHAKVKAQPQAEGPNQHATELPEVFNPKIALIGVGGYGTNVVDNLMQMDLSEVKFIAANTDVKSLNRSHCDNKICLGAKLTRGLGAGSKPEIGLMAAEQSKEAIESALKGVDLLIVAAGMGGGTGTGAAPFIAQMAKDLNILTLGFVTMPFSFEGHNKMLVAQEGLKNLEQHIDALTIFDNHNIEKALPADVSMPDAYRATDSIIYSAIKAIFNLITADGMVNLDFNDIKYIIKDGGRALVSSVEVSGSSDKAHEATEKILHNPLLLEGISLVHATNILISLTGGPAMRLAEVSKIINSLRAKATGSEYINFGAAIDEKLKDKVRVCVIATGIKSKALEVCSSPLAADDPLSTHQKERSHQVAGPKEGSSSQAEVRHKGAAYSYELAARGTPSYSGAFKGRAERSSLAAQEQGHNPQPTEGEEIRDSFYHAPSFQGQTTFRDHWQPEDDFLPSAEDNYVSLEEGKGPHPFNSSELTRSEPSDEEWAGGEDEPGHNSLGSSFSHSAARVRASGPRPREEEEPHENLPSSRELRPGLESSASPTRGRTNLNFADNPFMSPKVSARGAKGRGNLEQGASEHSADLRSTKPGPAESLFSMVERAKHSGVADSTKEVGADMMSLSKNSASSSKPESGARNAARVKASHKEEAPSRSSLFSLPSFLARPHNK